MAKIVFKYEHNKDVIGYKTDMYLYSMLGPHYDGAYCYAIEERQWYRKINSPAEWGMINPIEVPKFMRAQALLLI